MKLKRCWVCARRIWWRPAKFYRAGHGQQPIHIACLRAALAGGRVML